MNKEAEESNKAGLKRTILEWLGILSVIAVLYVSGLHTQVLGTLQRAMLWTGLFDAERTEVATADGPFLDNSDYSFAFVDDKGSRLDLQAYEGEVVFMNVWASWCPPCVAEMPTIETLYQEVSDHEDINFVILSLDQEPDKAAKFMKSRDFEMPYHFPASSLPEIFNSPYLPTTYVISKEGQVIYKKEGIADYSSPGYSKWLIELADK